MPVLKKSTHCTPQSLETEVLALISKTTDGMFANDDTGRILIWNRTAEDILGYAAKDVLGKACYQVVSGREFSGLPFCFKGCSVIAMGKAHHVMKDFTVQTRTKTQRPIWIKTRIMTISTEKWRGPIIIHLFHEVPPPREDPRREAAPPSPGAPELSPREQDVLVLLARCLVAKEIGTFLNISTGTARTHIQRILKKLNTHSKLEAVIIAVQQGLIESDALQAFPDEQ